MKILGMLVMILFWNGQETRELKIEKVQFDSQLNHECFSSRNRQYNTLRKLMKFTEQTNYSTKSINIPFFLQKLKKNNKSSDHERARKSLAQKRTQKLLTDSPSPRKIQSP
jgi:hypothetical protein